MKSCLQDQQEYEGDKITTADMIDHFVQYVGCLIVLSLGYIMTSSLTIKQPATTSHGKLKQKSKQRSKYAR